MVIERADRTVCLCEMKYSDSEFVLTKEYAKHLLHRKMFFRDVTKTRKSISLVLVSTYGAAPGKHSTIIDKQVILDDLFVEI